MITREIECLFCAEPFISKRGGRLCPTCKKQRRDYLRDKRDAREAEVTERVTELLPEGVAVPNKKDVKYSLYREGARTTLDMQPVGWLSALGGEDGCSTRFADLAGYLETQRAAVARHSWFSEHPHWAVGIPGSEDLLNREGISEMSCGRKQGTTAGYWRHKRDKTMVCSSCTEAYQEYMKGYMQDKRTC